MARKSSHSRSNNDATRLAKLYTSSLEKCDPQQIISRSMTYVRLQNTFSISSVGKEETPKSFELPDSAKLFVLCVGKSAVAQMNGICSIFEERVTAGFCIGPKLPTVLSEMVDQVEWRECRELQRREKAYRGNHSAAEISDRRVILVDDGLVTG